MDDHAFLPASAPLGPAFGPNTSNPSPSAANLSIVDGNEDFTLFNHLPLASQPGEVFYEAGTFDNFMPKVDLGVGPWDGELGDQVMADEFFLPKV